ncbi:MAG: 50S ribosomal protein L9 [Coxiella sp. RIFCSPHIGHO2_12_FULL_44_14]|nr:MAG: 50S ribosomal protein L9 [Coxiella sp. RIFCSPHIGHO2_12_FULL_44_14]
MRVILQEKVSSLGNVGDQVTVKPGYGRNFLIPYGKAVLATPQALAEFEKRRTELEKTAAEVLRVVEERAQALSQMIITIAARAGEEGKLFGSIGARDIAEAITQQGAKIEKSEIDLPEGPLRSLGEYVIRLRLHGDVKATVKVVIKGE